MSEELLQLQQHCQKSVLEFTIVRKAAFYNYAYMFKPQ